MLRVAVYELHPSPVQVKELLGLHTDYAALCKEVVEFAREVEPTLSLYDLHEVASEYVRGREVPARYVTLAVTRAWRDTMRRCTGDYTADSVVDLDKHVATALMVSAIDQPPQMGVSIKTFGSKARERLVVPCEFPRLSDGKGRLHKHKGQLSHHGEAFEVFFVVEAQAESV